MEFAPRQPVPVFPLPGALLFPRAVLPLHVFELRYRTMVREALSAERLLVIAMLKAGLEPDERQSAPFHPIACLARFEEVEWLPNDCYNLRLLGLSRVRVERIVRDFPYRTARLSLIPQEPLSEDDPLVELERRALLDAFTRLAHRALPESERPAASVAEAMSFEQLVNVICMALTMEPDQRLGLLELDSLIERSRRTRALVEARLEGAMRRREPGGERN